MWRCRKVVKQQGVSLAAGGRQQELVVVVLQAEQQLSIGCGQGSEGRSAVGGLATVEWGLAAGGAAKS